MLEKCIHGLLPSWCALCREGNRRKGSAVYSPDIGDDEFLFLGFSGISSSRGKLVSFPSAEREEIMQENGVDNELSPSPSGNHRRQRGEKPTLEELERAKQEGLNREEMASRWGGVSVATVSRWLNEAHIILRRGRRKTGGQKETLSVTQALSILKQQRAPLIAEVKRTEKELEIARDNLSRFDKMLLDEVVGTP